MVATTAVVLAGGTSLRFGTDKLDHVLAPGETLLQRAVAGLPPEFAVVLVGPARPLGRPVRVVREEPVGSGPAAALVRGVTAALARGADEVVVLPGDAPGAGLASLRLLRALRDDPAAAAVWGMDDQGREQPLQLALTPGAARELVHRAGPDGAAGASARRLVGGLTGLVALRLPAAEHWDIDTAKQLAAWAAQDAPSVTAVLDAVAQLRRSGRGGPLVVALDGRSCAGKSTLATALALRTDATVLEGDDFYGPALPSLTAAERDAMSDAEVADAVIDWRRLRTEALEPLRAGREAVYRPYDWDAHDGRLGELRRLRPADLVVVEGVYAARPELADLVDLTVSVDVTPEVRASRQVDREQDDPGWVDFWERGEEHYFAVVRPPASFDLRVPGSAP